MEGDTRRGWLGFGAAVAPHLALLGCLLVQSVRHGWVAYYGVLEIFLAPLGVIASLLLWFSKPARAFAGGVAGGTAAGFALVGLFVLAVGAAGGG
ncbi:hypothetical protein ACTOB_004488 [Actinoplanes oblitus]|uniref:Uncharacterized protein n=1 Tax=Actinoplanes oblitus TaxID=3040509 RepID=A0ABY8W3Z8_9ACTN|nr:hypothetical protein [Actinoplanes oblitus]WIM92545.1 hypothetical protein ACTOB_004488 [Actinoplanes oblitus]